VSNKRFVDNGKILTTAGLSSGIDGTLYLVSKIRGKGFAQQVALNMEYNWQPDLRYARANLADKYLRRMINRRLRFEVPNQVSVKVLSTQGTTDQWKAEWELQANSSLSEIRNFLEGKLQELGKWSRASGQKSASEWKFTGDNGEKWSGNLNVARVEGQQNLFRVTLEISKRLA